MTTQQFAGDTPCRRRFGNQPNTRCEQRYTPTCICTRTKLICCRVKLFINNTTFRKLPHTHTHTHTPCPFLHESACFSLYVDVSVSEVASTFFSKQRSYITSIKTRQRRLTSSLETSSMFVFTSTGWTWAQNRVKLVVMSDRKMC